MEPPRRESSNPQDSSSFYFGEYFKPRRTLDDGSKGGLDLHELTGDEPWLVKGDVTDFVKNYGESIHSILDATVGDLSVPVYENEPSSLIAFSLASRQHQDIITEIPAVTLLMSLASFGVA
jgi:hypothetical protein